MTTTEDRRTVVHDCRRPAAGHSRSAAGADGGLDAYRRAAACSAC